MLDIFTAIQARLATFKNEDGATGTEYAILVTLISVALVAMVGLFLTYLGGKFGSIAW